MNLTENQKQLGAQILENGFNPLDVVLHYVDLYNTDQLNTDIKLKLYSCFEDGFLKTRKGSNHVYTLIMEPILRGCFWELVGKFHDKNGETIIDRIKTYPKYDMDMFCGDEYSDYAFWIAEQVMEELDIEWFW